MYPHTTIILLPESKGARTPYATGIGGVNIEEMQDQDDDLRQPAQRRHINTIAGDVQQQMHELEVNVQGSVQDIRAQINAVQRRLSVILETLPAAQHAPPTQR